MPRSRFDVVFCELKVHVSPDFPKKVLLNNIIGVEPIRLNPLAVAVPAVLFDICIFTDLLIKYALAEFTLFVRTMLFKSLNILIPTKNPKIIFLFILTLLE